MLDIWECEAATETPVRLTNKAEEEPPYHTGYYLTPLSINGKRESARFVPDPFLGRGLPARTTAQAGESVREGERLAGGARHFERKGQGSYWVGRDIGC